MEAYQGILKGMPAKGMAGEAETVIARVREVGGGNVRPDPLLLVRSALGRATTAPWPPLTGHAGNYPGLTGIFRPPCDTNELFVNVPRPE